MIGGCSEKCRREGVKLFREDYVGEIVERHVDADY